MGKSSAAGTAPAAVPAATGGSVPEPGNDSEGGGVADAAWAGRTARCGGVAGGGGLADGYRLLLGALDQRGELGAAQWHRGQNARNARI
jgi:hypothetical protein